MLDPAACLATLRIVVGPVEDAAAVVVLELAPDEDPVADGQRVDARGEVDVVRDEQGVAVGQLHDEALVAAAAAVVGQQADHGAAALHPEIRLAGAPGRHRRTIGGVGVRGAAQRLQRGGPQHEGEAEQRGDEAPVDTGESEGAARVHGRYDTCMADSGARRHLEDRTLPLSGGGELRYAFAPPDPDATDAPLVIGLHYGWEGAMPPRHARDYLRVFLEPTFAGHGAVLAAPYCPARSWHHPRSEAAVLELVDALVEELPVDPDRVVLAGYSLGGMGTWYLGARYPDRFAGGMAVAAAPVLYRKPEEEGSGLPNFLELAERGIVPWHDGLRDFRLFVVHSDADELIPHDPVARAVRSLERRGADLEFVTLPAVGHYDSREYVTALRPYVAELLDVRRRSPGRGGAPAPG